MGFDGVLPDGIDPAAHGLPWSRAVRFLGNPEAWMAWRTASCDAYRSSAWGRSLDAYRRLRAGVDEAIAAGLPAVPEAAAPEAAVTDKSRDAANRLLSAERAYRASFDEGLHRGLSRAFGWNGCAWRWIAPQSWPRSEQLHPPKLALPLTSIHVHDTHELPFEIALYAFASADLVAEIERLEEALPGLPFGTGLDDEWWTEEGRRYRALREEATRDLFEQFLSGRLLIPGLHESEIPADPWTGERDASLLEVMGFCLPAPGGDVAATSETVQVSAAPPENLKPRRHGGPNPRYDWVDIHIRLGAKLAAEGVPAEGDGGQAQLEAWVQKLFLPRRAPAESLIREHVAKAIAAHRAELGKAGN